MHSGGRDGGEEVGHVPFVDLDLHLVVVDATRQSSGRSVPSRCSRPCSTRRRTRVEAAEAARSSGRPTATIRPAEEDTRSQTSDTSSMLCDV